MKEEIVPYQNRQKEPCTYCIRCGKTLRQRDVYYSKHDPDCEESMCFECYKRYEKSIESED